MASGYHTGQHRPTLRGSPDGKSIICDGTSLKKAIKD